jgi:hypothetical protein
VQPFTDQPAATIRWWGPTFLDRRAGTIRWWGPPNDAQPIWIPPDRTPWVPAAQTVAEPAWGHPEPPPDEPSWWQPSQPQRPIGVAGRVGFDGNF